MLETAAEGSGDNGYTVFPPHPWKHMETMVRYNIIIIIISEENTRNYQVACVLRWLLWHIAC